MRRRRKAEPGEREELCSLGSAISWITQTPQRGISSRRSRPSPPAFAQNGAPGFGAAERTLRRAWPEWRGQLLLQTGRPSWLAPAFAVAATTSEILGRTNRIPVSVKIERILATDW